MRIGLTNDLALVESRLTNVTSPSVASFPGSPLYLLVGCELPVEDFVATLRELQQAGVGLFQIRDKHADGAQLLKYARTAVATVGPECVVVNDRVDVALASGAGAVHVGQEDLPIAEVRRLCGRKLWIGVSTHDIAQARAAQQAGTDYIGCGPTFPSTTKQFKQFAGIDFLKQVAVEISIPAYAIGGISIDNIDLVRQTGFSRVAVSGAICWRQIRATRLRSWLKSSCKTTNPNKTNSMQLDWDPEIDTPATIAVIGGGPCGVEAALYGRFLGYSVGFFDVHKVGDSLVAWGNRPMPGTWREFNLVVGTGGHRSS